MRVGIFGGTFDPVHMGHLRASEEIREAYSLDRIYFIPAHIPPHKRSREITDPELRLTMLKHAIRGNNFLRASEMEIRNGGVSYSINTIKTFERRFKKVYFVIGIDAFSEIHTWHLYREIFNHTNFIVMGRPRSKNRRDNGLFPADVGKDIRKINGHTFEHVSRHRIYMESVTQLDISSTKIRDAVRDGRSIKYLVPQSVEKFILERGLYKN